MLNKPKKSKKQGSSSKIASCSKPSTSSKSPKGKGKEGEIGTSENTGGDDDHEHEVLKFFFDDSESSEHEKGLHNKRINELENHLEAITHRGDLQEVGVFRLYSVE